MKYKQQIDELFEFMAEGIEDCDIEEFTQEILTAIGQTYESLNDDIEIGVKNGYPVEVQIELTKRQLEKLF